MPPESVQTARTGPRLRQSPAAALDIRPPWRPQWLIPGFSGADPAAVSSQNDRIGHFEATLRTGLVRLRPWGSPLPLRSLRGDQVPCCSRSRCRSLQFLENPSPQFRVVAWAPWRGGQTRAASKPGQGLQLIARATRRIPSALACWRRDSGKAKPPELSRATLRQPWGADRVDFLADSGGTDLDASSRSNRLQRRPSARLGPSPAAIPRGAAAAARLITRLVSQAGSPPRGSSIEWAGAVVHY